MHVLRSRPASWVDRRTDHTPLGDEQLLADIREQITELPSFGYRRACAPARWSIANARAPVRRRRIERDLPRGPPPSKVDVTRLVRLTTQSKPDATTHRNTHTMTAELGVSTASVSRHWRSDGLKPHLVRGFKVSRDPKFVDKLEDIMGLYVSPPWLARDGAVLRRTRRTKCRRWIACSPGRR